MKRLNLGRQCVCGICPEGTRNIREREWIIGHIRVGEISGGRGGHIWAGRVSGVYPKYERGVVEGAMGFALRAQKHLEEKRKGVGANLGSGFYLVDSYDLR